VAFTVRPPFWRSTWFLAAVALAAAAALYLAHRARVGRAVAIERVRTHIATDLHDDIGASLSQIAILNEVALARAGAGADAARPLLESAAQSARELVDTMSDIVWSVDPRRDHVGEVVTRMRRFAEELCAARGIRLDFDAPDRDTRRLEASLRRQLFLVFKEGLNNAVKHSGCRSVRVALRTGARALDLAVIDDGSGFDPARAPQGNGLASMRRRAHAVRGLLTLRSSPGAGTELRFSAPL
jgi:signal transduction histidine kinase